MKCKLPYVGKPNDQVKTMREKKYFFVFCGIFLALFLVVAAGAWRTYSRLEGQAPAATINAATQPSSSVARD